MSSIISSAAIRAEPEAASRLRAGRRRDLRLATRLSVVLGVLLTSAAAVGVVTGLSGTYDPYPPSEAGLVAQDLVVLVVALPVLGTSMLLARRGSVLAALAWAGALFYAAYTYYFMVIGAFTALFPLYVGIVATATYAVLALLFGLDFEATASELHARMPRRTIAAFFLVTVVVFVVLWGGLVASSIAAGEVIGPVQHLVVAIDGAILLPILAYAGVQLLRRAASGYVLAGVMIVKAGLTGFTLAFSGAFVMWWTAEFNPFEAFLVAIFGVMALVAAAVWITFLRWPGSREQPAEPRAAVSPDGGPVP
jgi:hypothetical protein